MIKGFYISHGSPTILTENNKWKDTLRSIGKRIKDELNPQTVVVVSPHFFSWSGTFLVETQEKLECIQDYYGFPDELYKFCYSAENDVSLAYKIIENAKRKGIDITEDNKWGLDHGAWIPLMYMFPEGIRAVTLSITDKSPEVHYKLGEAIAQSIDKNVLILGTGSPTHILELFYFNIKPKQSNFDRKLIDLLNKGDFDSIMKLEETKEWKQAQPEGFLRPMYVVMGAIRPKKAEVIDYAVPWPGVSMLACEFKE